MDRKDTFIGIRPNIQSATFDADTSEQEKFQNQVLRPVIKLQHEFLLVYFNQYLLKHKRDIKATDLATRVQIIEKILQSDIPLRNILIGSIVGLLTEPEVIKYYENESELRNRIIKMIIKRFAEAI